MSSCFIPLSIARCRVAKYIVRDSLSAEDTHHLNIRTFCDARFPGITDFYETLIDHPRYRSRIKLAAPYDGSGVFRGEGWLIPAELEGEEVRLRVWRLYREFEGVRAHSELHGNFEQPGTPYSREELVDVTIKVVDSSHSGMDGEDGSHGQQHGGDLFGWVKGWGGSTADKVKLPLCSYEDFHRSDWSGGFWYREELTDESWHFHLPHCRTRKFSQDEASECLNGKWIGFLGDSTALGQLCGLENVDYD